MRIDVSGMHLAQCVCSMDRYGVVIKEDEDGRPIANCEKAIQNIVTDFYINVRNQINTHVMTMCGISSPEVLATHMINSYLTLAKTIQSTVDWDWPDE